MCIFIVCSKTNSFKKFLSNNSDFPVYNVYDKGDQVDIGTDNFDAYDDFGFHCEVSDRDWNDFDGQIIDLISFLEVYQPILTYIRDNFDIDDWRFDIPYECQLDENKFTQSTYLPSKAMKLISELEIGLELSLYWPDTE